MNCKACRDRLSEYIDRSLPEAERAEVEAHLATCAECREGKAALEQVVADVAALDAVEPPPGFSRQVMAKIRAEEAKPTFWERCVLAFKLNMPMQVTALFLVAGLAVYLYRVNPLPQKNIAQTPSFDEMPESARRPSPSENAIGQDRSNQRMAQKDAAPLGFAESEEKREIAAAPSNEGLAERENFSDEQTRFRNENPDALTDKAPASNTPAALMDDKVIDRLSEVAESATPSKEQAVPDALEWTLALKPSDRHSGFREDLVALLQKVGGGSQLKQDIPEVAQKSEQEETLWITLPKTQHDAFKTELAALGTLSVADQKDTAKTAESIPAKKAIKKPLNESLPQSKSKALLKQEPSLQIKLIIRRPHP